jgi:hypothetical protein
MNVYKIYFHQTILMVTEPGPYFSVPKSLPLPACAELSINRQQRSTSRLNDAPLSMHTVVTLQRSAHPDRRCACICSYRKMVGQIRRANSPTIQISHVVPPREQGEIDHISGPLLVWCAVIVSVPTLLGFWICVPT